MSERAQAGEEARRILESRVFNEAFEVLRAAYVSGLQSLPSGDDLGRFRYVEALKQVDAVKRHLSATLANGEIAQAEIAEMNRQAGLVERLVRKF